MQLSRRMSARLNIECMLKKEKLRTWCKIVAKLKYSLIYRYSCQNK